MLIRRPAHLFLFLLLVLSACKNDLEEVNQSFTTKKMPDAITKNLIMIFSDSGIVKFKLFAPVRHDFVDRMQSKSYSIMPKGLTIQFFEGGDSVTTTLTANFGKLYNGGDMLLVHDSVVIKSKDGKVLKTQELTWNSLQNMIKTDAYVEIYTKQQVIMGDGLVAKDDFSWYRILKPIGTLYVSDN